MRPAGRSLFPKGTLRREGARDVAASALKPGSIVAAAEADLALRQAQRGLRMDGDDRGARPYCFHRTHVARASCALDLIDRAIADRYSGVYCGKRITRIIYGDENLLWEARAIVAIGDGVAA
jgi:hypothetical protein